MKHISSAVNFPISQQQQTFISTKICYLLIRSMFMKFRSWAIPYTHNVRRNTNTFFPRTFRNHNKNSTDVRFIQNIDRTNTFESIHHMHLSCDFVKTAHIHTSPYTRTVTARGFTSPG